MSSSAPPTQGQSAFLLTQNYVSIPKLWWLKTKESETLPGEDVRNLI
jgi:hypothetical protein